MHASIEKLLRVQDVDSQILFMREAMRVRPQELNDDRVKVDQAKSAVAALQSRIKSARMAADARELDIRKFDDEITKLTVALNQAKSNDEYSVIRDGIERQKEMRGGAEEDVLLQLQEIDRLEEDRKVLESNLEELAKTLERKERELEELLGGLRAQLDELETQRSGLVDGVDSEHLGLYDRVLDRHQNFAIARVEGQICKGCNMRLTPQEVNLLLQDTFVQCRNCSRLLCLATD